MGAGGQGQGAGSVPIGQGAQPIGGSNKGGGNPALQSMPQGGMSTWQDYASVLQAQLQQQQQQQQAANIFGQGLQRAGALVGQQLPYMQAQRGSVPQPIPQAVAPPNPAGQLFPQQGMGGMGASGGGIDEQQLAMILRQLGYGV
jgi:hypothetical protein